MARFMTSAGVEPALTPNGGIEPHLPLMGVVAIQVSLVIFALTFFIKDERLGKAHLGYNYTTFL
jgi:hypothetical protein